MPERAPAILPTTVVGSYSVPEWLGRLKTDHCQRRISTRQLSEIHDVVIKAALKDQELAGVDIVSDGELRRDNDIDYLLGRLPGVIVSGQAKTDYYDYLDAEVTGPLEQGDSEHGLGLAADLIFTRAQTSRPVKFSFTGPFSLSRGLRAAPAVDRAELVRSIARRLNAEASALASAGAAILQIDEPFLAGYPEQVDLAIEAVNIVTAGVDATWALHVCYGNRHARPLWEGHYDFLFPAVLAASVDQLVLEFARKGQDDLRLFGQFGWDRMVGLGVIDVKSSDVEAPELVATRIRQALAIVPAERLMINPDCGLRDLPASVARAKLRAMADGAAMVRDEIRSSRRSRQRQAAGHERTGQRRLRFHL
jgi:5-methyltetrahydropteroyltriglutamate--homocysteine methyltransferase